MTRVEQIEECPEGSNIVDEAFVEAVCLYSAIQDIHVAADHLREEPGCEDAERTLVVALLTISGTWDNSTRCIRRAMPLFIRCRNTIVQLGNVASSCGHAATFEIAADLLQSAAPWLYEDEERGRLAVRPGAILDDDAFELPPSQLVEQYLTTLDSMTWRDLTALLAELHFERTRSVGLLEPSDRTLPQAPLTLNQIKIVQRLQEGPAIQVALENLGLKGQVHRPTGLSGLRERGIVLHSPDRGYYLVGHRGSGPCSSCPGCLALESTLRSP